MKSDSLYKNSFLFELSEHCFEVLSVGEELKSVEIVNL